MDTDDGCPGKRGFKSILVLISHGERQAIMGMPGFMVQECVEERISPVLSHGPHHQRDAGAWCIMNTLGNRDDNILKL